MQHNHNPQTFSFIGDPATLAAHLADAIRAEGERLAKLEPALNIREAAEVLRCTPAHLSANVDRWGIPCRNVGTSERRILVFSRRALEQWLQEGNLP